jgi:hypothetical protein
MAVRGAELPTWATELSSLSSQDTSQNIFDIVHEFLQSSGQSGLIQQVTKCSSCVIYFCNPSNACSVTSLRKRMRGLYGRCRWYVTPALSSCTGIVLKQHCSPIRNWSVNIRSSKLYWQRSSCENSLLKGMGVI